MVKFLPSRTFEAIEKSLSTLVDEGCRVKYLLARFKRAVTILPLCQILGPKSQVVFAKFADNWIMVDENNKC